MKKYIDLAYIKAYTRQYFEDKSNFYTTIGMVVFLSVWGGYKLYKRHDIGVQSRAQAQFAQSMDVYNKALTMQLLDVKSGNATFTEWDDAELAFRSAYEQNSSAGIAPFFLVYQAQSLAWKADYKNALDVLDRAQQSFKNDVNWDYLFKTTKALIMFDVEQHEAIKSLNELGADEKNPLNQMALYYLGEYYYANNNLDAAKKAYSDVIAKETKNALDIKAPWAELAQNRLAQL